MNNYLRKQYKKLTDEQKEKGVLSSYQIYPRGRVYEITENDNFNQTKAQINYMLKEELSRVKRSGIIRLVVRV